MKNLIKRKMQKFIRWVFAEELRDIKNHIVDAEAQVSHQKYLSGIIKQDTDRLTNILGNIDVSVDVHHHARSWACISIQGKTDYVKFVDLGEAQIREISHFISRFDRSKIDAAPNESKFIKMESRQMRGF